MITCCILNGIFWKELPASRRDSYRAGDQIKNLQLFIACFFPPQYQWLLLRISINCMEFVRRNQSLAVLPSLHSLADYIFLKFYGRICVLSTEFRVAR